MAASYATSAVLVTGASRGIGRVIASSFAQKTNRPLILVARNQAGLKKTQELCQKAGAQHVCILACDLTDEQAVATLKIPESFPPPGTIINNAGLYLLKYLQQTEYSDFMNQIQSNLFSAVHIVNRFLEDLKTLDRSLLVNICSIGALQGLKESGAYSAAKHALLGYTRSLRLELMADNIAVTALNLGQTHSTSWEGSKIDPKRLVDPADVGRLLTSLAQMSPHSVVEEIKLAPMHGRVPPM